LHQQAIYILLIFYSLFSNTLMQKIVMKQVFLSKFCSIYKYDLTNQNIVLLEHQTATFLSVFTMYRPGLELSMALFSTFLLSNID